MQQPQSGILGSVIDDGDEEALDLHALSLRTHWF